MNITEAFDRYLKEQRMGRQIRKKEMGPSFPVGGEDKRPPVHERWWFKLLMHLGPGIIGAIDE